MAQKVLSLVDGVITEVEIETPSGAFPYYIPEGNTYTVARFGQGLFTMNFIADGVIETDGVMVEVY